MKRLLLFLTLFVASLVVNRPASAQVSVQFRANDGTILATYTNVMVIFKEDASTTVSFSPSSNTVIVSATAAGTLYYQTVAAAGSAAPQETVLNFAAPFTATDSSGTHTTTIDLPVCAEGSTHNSGQVPDPGGTGGTTKFLREDCTFVVPYYQVTQTNGTPVTKRGILNFLPPLAAADNSGNSSTDVSITSGTYPGIHGTPTAGNCADWFDATHVEDAGTGPCGSSSGATIHGTPTAGNCTDWFSTTAVEDAGQPCGTGGGSSGANVFLFGPKNSNDSGFSGLSILLKIDASMIANTATGVQVTYCLNSGSQTFGAQVLRTSAIGATTFDPGSTAVTYGSLPTPTLTSGCHVSDTATFTIDGTEDVWIITYVASSAADVTPTYDVFSDTLWGYHSGDQTAVSSIPALTSSRSAYSRLISQ